MSKMMGMNIQPVLHIVVKEGEKQVFCEDVKISDFEKDLTMVSSDPAVAIPDGVTVEAKVINPDEIAGGSGSADPDFPTPAAVAPEAQPDQAQANGQDDNIYRSRDS